MLPFSLKFRLASRKGPGLQKAPIILQTELRKTLTAVGERLRASAELRMRKNTGSSVKALKVELEGRGLDVSIIVYSVLIQSFIDAYGLRPGVRIPFGVGSRVHNWAQTKVRNGPSNEPKKTFPVHAGAGPRRVFQTKGTVAQRVSRLTNSTRKVRGSRRIANKNKQASRLAFLVAKTIFLRGIRATHWNSQALQANRSRIIRELKNAISRAVVRMNQG